MPRYDSRTSGHRKGATELGRIAGWNLAERVSRSTRCASVQAEREEERGKERRTDAGRQIGRKRAAGKAQRGVVARKSFRITHRRGDSISDVWRDYGEDATAHGVRCRPRITETRRASGTDRPRSRCEIRVMKLRSLRNCRRVLRYVLFHAPFPPFPTRPPRPLLRLHQRHLLLR